jgi:ABC-type molybdenum transport system ATPase subunit/photorepair protein PhrA
MNDAKILDIAGNLSILSARDDKEAASPTVLSWDEIVVNKGGKDIVKGIGGTAYSGEVTAIMGHSGSGKSPRSLWSTSIVHYEYNSYPIIS